MPPIRNFCVGRGVIAAGALANAYTVPAGYAFILKDISVSFGGLTGTNWSAAMVEATSGQQHAFVYQKVPTQLVDGWEGWKVLNAGDTLQLTAVGNVMTYWVSGAVLPFVPGF